MFPVLFEINGIKVFSYGFFIALGYLACIAVLLWRAPKHGIPGIRAIDLAFFSLLFGLIGARLLFVATNIPYFMKFPMETLYVWHGGLVFYGGFITAIPFVLWYTRRHGLSLWSSLDVMALGLVVGHAFGRIGCLGAGCCHGRACDLPWAVTIDSDMIDPILRGVPVHPTQAYESAGLFAIFFSLLWIESRKPAPGTVAIAYLMSYALLRSIVELFRGDSIRGYVIPNALSTSQFISLVVVLVCSVLLFRRLRGGGGVL